MLWKHRDGVIFVEYMNKKSYELVHLGIHFMGTSDVLKVRKIAQAVLLLTEPIKIKNCLILYLPLVRKRGLLFLKEK